MYWKYINRWVIRRQPASKRSRIFRRVCESSMTRARLFSRDSFAGRLSGSSTRDGTPAFGSGLLAESFVSRVVHRITPLCKSNDILEFSPAAVEPPPSETGLSFRCRCAPRESESLIELLTSRLITHRRESEPAEGKRTRENRFRVENARSKIVPLVH